MQCRERACKKMVFFEPWDIWKKKNPCQVTKADQREIKSIDLIGGANTNPVNKH